MLATAEPMYLSVLFDPPILRLVLIRAWGIDCGSKAHRVAWVSCPLSIR
jgi:hypothetical protein